MPQKTPPRNAFVDQARDFYVSTAALREAPWIGYAAGTGLTAFAMLVRVLIGDALQGFPFLTFFSAVIVTSFVFGWRAGALSAVLGGLLAWYYLIEPADSFALTWPSGYIALTFYIFTTGVIVLLTGAMQQSFSDYAASERALSKLNAELEQRVALRTTELAEGNDKLTAEAASRMLAEGQVQQLQKMEAIGHLTGGIAHDFNNMLAIILGSLDMAKRNFTRDTARVEKAIDAAMEGARRAADLTARLLAFSRQQPLDPKPLDANKLVFNMSELLRRTLGETIRVETVLAGGLWRAFVDPSQVSNALLNLCVNSRDAMPGGGCLTIETSNAHLDDAYAAQHAEVRPGQYVVIAVTDTGSGMGPDVIEHAFDPFYTTKTAGHGTGLGLSQVYGFVKQSRGHVKIYSEPGTGTTVKIYLPRYTGESPTIEHELPAQATPRALDGDVILVVEDDDRVRQMTTEALIELGYTVVAAPGGAQALAELQARPRIDLLFTDIVMPGMNGRQLVETAHKIKPELKVLYTTGYTRNAIVHNGMLDPGIALLPKPFSLHDLAVKLRQVLEG